tara:strand:+ start:588 stop:1088 length:501 start_codon:yes stop_codon:yes gene_type:complete
MKTYKFKVEVPEVNNGKSSLMDSFINEARDEQRQLDITHKINKKTTEVHRQILIDFITEINEELSSIGFNEFKLSDELLDEVGNNYYYGSEAILQTHKSFRLYIEGENDREFEDSKYTTFTGKYEFKFGYGNSPYAQRVRTVDDVLTKLKDEIIKHIKKNREIVAN